MYDNVENMQCNIRVFADDTSLYIIVFDPTVAAQSRNTGMEKIHRLEKMLLLLFNPGLFDSLLFSRKINKTPFYMYYRYH